LPESAPNQSGWEVYEAKRYALYCGERAREDALSYAHRRAGYAPTKIDVLDNEANVVVMISPESVRGLI
jgi:hypothetical protein